MMEVHDNDNDDDKSLAAFYNLIKFIYYCNNFFKKPSEKNVDVKHTK